MRNKANDATFGIFLLIIGSLILYYLVNRIGIVLIKETLRNVKIEYLLYGICSAALSLVIRAFKWHIALELSLQMHFRFYLTLLVYFSNSMISYFTPLKSGELLAPLLFKKYTNLEYGKGFSIIVVDRFLELVMMLFLVVLSLIYLFSSSQSGLQDLKLQFSVVIILFTCIICFLVFASTDKNGTKIVGFVKKRVRLNRFLSFINSFYYNIRLLKTKISVLTFFTFLAWIIDSASFYFFFNSIIDVSYYKAAVIEFISACMGVITFIPGGLGVSEFSAVILLEKMSYNSVLSTSAAILLRIPMLLVIILGLSSIFCNYLMSKSKDE